MQNTNYTDYYWKKAHGAGNALSTSDKFGSGTFNPKKAVKHFTDLDVYQKALEASVFVTAILDVFYNPKTKIKKAEKSENFCVQEYIIKNMSALALSIPHQIAEAHSKRFGSGVECLLVLDKVMLNCNKMVVYLDETRDICKTGLELEQFEEQVKKYFFIRQKVLNLQRVWRKYIEINKQEQKK